MAETRRENLVGRNLWADIIKMRDEQRENLKGAIQIVRREDLPLENNEQGLMRWYMHPEIKDIVLHTMIFFEQEIAPGSRSGRVKFQGGQVIFVVEGRGYTMLDGVKHAWEAGDVLNIPLRKHGVVMQHFNSDGETTARFVVTEPNLFAATSVDRGCGFEQLETSPDFKG
jgi:gentisate 1,2-dioxygenase